MTFSCLSQKVLVSSVLDTSKYFDFLTSTTLSVSQMVLASSVVDLPSYPDIMTNLTRLLNLCQQVFASSVVDPSPTFQSAE